MKKERSRKKIKGCHKRHNRACWNMLYSMGLSHYMLKHKLSILIVLFCMSLCMCLSICISMHTFNVMVIFIISYGRFGLWLYHTITKKFHKQILTIKSQKNKLLTCVVIVVVVIVAVVVVVKMSLRIGTEQQYKSSIIRMHVRYRLMRSSLF